MKKLLLLFIALFLVTFLTDAQEHKNDKRIKQEEKIKTLKIGFITEKLNLTSKEAEKFWPVHNKYEKLLHSLERESKIKLKLDIKKAGGIDKITENEATSFLKQITTLEDKITETKNEYNKQLIKVLSPKKILKLQIIERDFIRNLIKKYRKKK